MAKKVKKEGKIKSENGNNLNFYDFMCFLIFFILTEKKLNFDISSNMERLTEGEGQYNWRHDTQHNGTQHNDIPFKKRNTQHDGT